MSAPVRETLAWIIVLLVVGALVWFVVRQPGTSAPPASTAPALRLQWREGATQHYRFVVGSTVRLSGSGAGGTEPMTQEVRGELELRTLAATPTGATVGMRLSPVELRVGGVVGDEVGRVLAQPFRVQFLPDGMPTAFAFPSAVDAPHAALLEELVRTFQLAVRDEPRWTVKETHGTGTYEACYERASGGELRRTKARYFASSTGDEMSADLRVGAATATVDLDPGVDWITRMDVDERLVRTDASGLTIEVATTARLQLLPVALAPAADLWQFTAGDAAATGRAAAPADRVLAGRTTDDLQAELHDIVADLDVMTEGRTVAIHRLRDLLRADARVADLLLTVLRERQLTDRTRADLFLAFELGATPAAQASLCRVIADAAWSQRDRTRALIALGGVSDPDEATLSAIWRATGNRSSAAAADQADTAILALGTIGNGMLAAKPGDYATIRDGLLSAAWGAIDPDERTMFVTALGNLGDLALVPEVVPFLDDRAAEVRRAAAKTLGKLGTEAVATELAQRLRHEASSRVRASLAAALGSCEAVSPAAMATAREAIVGEQDEATRLDLARLLRRHVATFPENREVLQTLLATEPSNKVRQCIEDALRAPVTAPGG